MSFFMGGFSGPRTVGKGRAGFALRGATEGGAPSGPVAGPPEYAPAEGIMMAYEGQTGWKRILENMAASITTAGEAMDVLRFACLLCASARTI